jgi:hypothetical protein
VDAAFGVSERMFEQSHWEDPEWRRGPVNQVLMGLAISELATGIEDIEVRKQVTAAVDEIVAKNASRVQR